MDDLSAIILSAIIALQITTLAVLLVTCILVRRAQVAAKHAAAEAALVVTVTQAHLDALTALHQKADAIILMQSKTVSHPPRE